MLTPVIVLKFAIPFTSSVNEGALQFTPNEDVNILPALLRKLLGVVSERLLKKTTRSLLLKVPALLKKLPEVGITRLPLLLR